MTGCCACFAGVVGRPQPDLARALREPLIYAAVPLHLQAARPKAEESVVAEEALAVEVRLISGVLVASPRVDTGTLVSTIIAQANPKRTVSAQLLHDGRVLDPSLTLASAGVQDGALLVLVLRKAIWCTALHGNSVLVDEIGGSARRLDPTQTFQEAVVISEHPARSFAVRLMERCPKWAGALEMGFVPQDVVDAARKGSMSSCLANAACFMGNSGCLVSVTSQRRNEEGQADDRYKGNWTSELDFGDVLRCVLDDEEKEGKAWQRLSIYVNDVLRLDHDFPRLPADPVYPAINLYGQTGHVQFIEA